MNEEEEKVYQFNEYVLGYDKGQKDRSCLTISKIQNGNIYVMSSLYDGSAEVISLMLDNLQQELERYKNIIDELEKYLKEENKFDEYKDITYRETMGYVLDKLKELRGFENE